jgi:ribosomal protein L10
MGNLRPAPAELTPQRADALIKAIDAHDGVALLRRIGLSASEIATIRRIARRQGVKPLYVATTLLSAAVEAVKAQS